jgi:hypothetical protein
MFLALATSMALISAPIGIRLSELLAVPDGYQPF